MFTLLNGKTELFPAKWAEGCSLNSEKGANIRQGTFVTCAELNRNLQDDE